MNKETSKDKENQECKWITVIQLEKKLQISRSTVHRWMRRGLIRAYRFEGSRALYFLDSEVDDFLKMNIIAPSGRIDKLGMNIKAT